MIDAFKRHWPEYLMEACELAVFMIAASVVVALLEHPGSPLAGVVPNPDTRRVLTGIAMGLTAIAIVYSPWGKRSGAHFNPSVTLTFYRLGKIDGVDAAFYSAAHFLGATLGVVASALILRDWIGHPSVNYVATVPGPFGPTTAFVGEAAISFVLMSTVLVVSNTASIARFTGVACGILVATFIALEAPLSGMSMNPARSFGPAAVGSIWAGAWVYFTAPLLGMLLAAEVYVRIRGRARVQCAKLHHQNRYRCIFCGDPGAGETARREKPTISPFGRSGQGSVRASLPASPAARTISAEPRRPENPRSLRSLPPFSKGAHPCDRTDPDPPPSGKGANLSDRAVSDLPTSGKGPKLCDRTDPDPPPLKKGVAAQRRGDFRTSCAKLLVAATSPWRDPSSKLDGGSRRHPSRLTIAAVAVLLASIASAAEPSGVRAVGPIGVTVSDLDRATAFFTEVLDFQPVPIGADSAVELTGADYERLEGVFGLRMRVARLRLGDESIELSEYLAPEGRPIPADSRSNDRWFQHIAIVVSDIDRAYARLREHKVRHASSGPQTLPDWNPNAGGISAFYFKDPDGHVLEIIHFPPGKGDPKWQNTGGKLFLGIDHTAIVVADTDESLKLYRDGLGLRVAGASENYGTEQEHLNNVFGARLRITGLRADTGPGIELLEYLAPRDGRTAPDDVRANDLVHWQTSLAVDDLQRTAHDLPRGVFSFVSPGIVDTPDRALGFGSAALVRDPDGHAMRLTATGR